MRSSRRTTFLVLISVAALLYTYAGYPLLVLVISSLRPRAVKRAEFLPKRPRHHHAPLPVHAVNVGSREHPFLACRRYCALSPIIMIWQVLA